MSDDISDLFEKAAFDSVIHCPRCGAELRTSTNGCSVCGWQSTIKADAYS